MPAARSLIDTMRTTVDSCDASSEYSLLLLSLVEDLNIAASPVVSSSSLSSAGAAAPSLPPNHPLTPANRSLRFLEAGDPGASQPHNVSYRLAIPDLCIASTRLLSCTDPFPLDRLSRQTAQAVRSWPAADRDQLLAVAHRDLHVARQNIAELILYADDLVAHLAACAGAEDNSIPLLSAETFPRLDGGIRAALQEID